MRKVFLYSFLLVSAGEILSTVVELPTIVHTLCKPLLMVTLALYYWFEKKHHQDTVSMVVLLAILFSGAGDVLLMFQENNPLFFMLGLLAFLTAHGSYIFAYRQHQSGDDAHALQGMQKIRFGFPIVFAAVGLVTILYDKLGALKIPVVVYASVLAYVALTALYRFGRTNAGSFTLVFAGAILFMMSDSLLAINKFMEPLTLASFWIMATYISAQFLIVRGLLKHS